MEHKAYILPKLPYDYDALMPVFSKEQLTIHHTKHHQAYVNGANAIFDKLQKAAKERVNYDVKALLKELSFNIAGHKLHSLFWKNICPTEKALKLPSEKIIESIDLCFGSFSNFKEAFTKAAVSVEGSGWAALVYDKESEQLLICQIEKHNLNLYPETKILLIIDVFEHAYYIDYKNDRAKYVEMFWNIINWDEVERRYEKAR